MVGDIEGSEKPRVDRELADFFIIALAVGLTFIIPGWDLLPKPEAVLVSWSIACAVGYWLPQRPHESYARWMLERIVLVSGFYLAFFKVPVWLKNEMSSWLAYGIPISTFFALYALALISSMRSGRKGESQSGSTPPAN